MADEFTVVGGLHQANAFDDYIEQQTGKYAAPNVALLASIRHHHPDMTVTVTTIGQANLLGYAGAVGAVAELDTSEDGVLRFRGFIAPTSEQDPGFLYDATQFARYKYTWKQLEFILYVVQINAYFIAEYIVFPPDSDEDAMSHSKATDALLMAVGQAEFPYRDDREYILVYDQHMWYKNRSLYYEVLKTTWDDVILDQGMKDTISHTIEEFFDNEKRYRDLDVPWKRGVIFYGPPGNGKTLSLRALMHSLSTRREQVNLLYVKSITAVYDIGMIFNVARAYSPCLLILEDIDSLVSGGAQSYFFNEVDGLANNDGIMMIATTNHLEKLDGGLANRPSRFDRKYNFPLPSYEERILYSEFWRKKLQDKQGVDFPKVLSPEIAKITEDFSFAYMKEAFIATLLAMARGTSNNAAKDDKDIDDLPFWKEMQKEVKILRDEMCAEQQAASIATPPRVDAIGSRQQSPEATKIVPPPRFDPKPTFSHHQNSQARPEFPLPHRPGTSISSDAPTLPSIASPTRRPFDQLHSFAAPALPVMPLPNHFPWKSTPVRDPSSARHDLASLGLSTPREPILGLDEASLRRLRMRQDTARAKQHPFI